jgi:hypothetical protein
LEQRIRCHQRSSYYDDCYCGIRQVTERAQALSFLWEFIMRAFAFEKLHVLHRRLQLSGCVHIPQAETTKVIQLTDQQLNDALRQHEHEVRPVLQLDATSTRWEYSFNTNGATVYVWTENKRAVEHYLGVI